MSNQKETVEKDARGQFAASIGDRKASGVASAKPTVITGSEDGTAHKMPPGSDVPNLKPRQSKNPTEINQK